MPPKGLYPVPRHNVYGGQMASRRSFNSNDFQPEPDKAMEAKTAVSMTDGANEAQDEREVQRRDKREEKKHRKSQGKEAKKAEAKSTGKDVDSTPVVSETKEQRKARRKREKAEAATELSHPTGSGLMAKPNTMRGGATATSTSAKKKRKRESETRSQTPTRAHGSAVNGGFVVGADLVDNVLASLSGREQTDAPSPAALQTPEKPAKRKKKSGRKSEAVLAEEEAKSTLGTPELKKTNAGKGTATPQPDDSPLAAIKTPRRTHVPPPELSYVLVQETPPSKAPVKNKTPAKKSAPQSQSQPVANAAAQPTPKKKGRPTTLDSTPTPAGNVCTPKPRAGPPGSAPAVVAGGVPRPAVPNALTDANLHKFTKPLSQTQETRLSRSAKSGVSTVTSMPDSVSTQSMMDAFVRVGKPYARSDPFAVAEVKAGRPRETHDEASMHDFNVNFRTVQVTVNFSDEREYLDEYLEWAQEYAANPLQCLGNVTGCTAKKEEILRLSKEENLAMLSHLDTEAKDLHALRDAAARIHLASELLRLSLFARVPVPIGLIEGAWKLYCPQYAETHFDRYGYGQRTLTLSSIAGFKDKSEYTARLHIPPRSMTYSVRAFSTPPHASFRTTMVKTAVEGYAMEILFLGNGYLKLRADLNLLLRGKATEGPQGKKTRMEFIGVHTKAVKWCKEEDELEVEGKRLFAKYDGAADE